jgi:GNAT superfamily N-acetyltransferase
MKHAQSYFIRELVNDDFDDLNKHFGAHTPYKNTRSKWEKYLHLQNIGERSVRVVEKDNQVIGIVTLKYISDYPYFRIHKIPEINDLLIAREYRKQGYGEALISTLENIARSTGHKTIGLGVGLYQDYGSAQRLYFKLGYIPDGMGITYQDRLVVPGNKYTVDDELILWLTKSL